MSMSVQRRRDRLNDAELANNLRIVQELAVFINLFFFLGNSNSSSQKP